MAVSDIFSIIKTRSYRSAFDLPGENIQDCCCDACPPCPSDCSGCAAKSVTLSGGSGCCCVIVNKTQALTRTGCAWAGNWFDGVTFASASFNITCDSGTGEFVYTLVITSKDSACAPSCTQAPNETWEYRQCSAECNVGGPDAGPVTMTHIQGVDCGGNTITMTVS